MKYRFAVTAFVDKEVEIEAENQDEAFIKMGEQLFDVNFTLDDMRVGDREYLMLDS